MKKLLLNLTMVNVFFYLVGCVGDFDAYSPSQIHRTVQHSEQGVYIVYFKTQELSEHYGSEKITAIPAYLIDKGLVPPECSLGITFIRGGDAEGGKGWAEFRCRE